MSNQMKNTTSQYLLQHEENPVNWYPWCGEAFEKAKSEDKPIFLSIGYSICHWCHVMAHESFEDEKTAEIIVKKLEKQSELYHPKNEINVMPEIFNRI